MTKITTGNPLPVALSEAAVKKAVADRLQIAQNQGKLLFLRLQSGELIALAGETRRRIKLCAPGTADFVVFQAVASSFTSVTFIECKSSTGKQSLKQQEFQAEVERLHCRYFIVRDAEELSSILGF